MTPRFSGKRFIVTGGAGFIGSHLVDALLDGGADKVAVVDNFFLGRDANLAQAAARHGDRLQVFREDAGEPAAMAAVIDAIKPDIVFNLATKALLYSFFNPAGAADVNVRIALALAELGRAGAYGRLVHFSTSEVYGSAITVPMDEDHPLRAETSYAAGKAAADLILRSYVNMFGQDILIIRPFNNYGPRQNDGALAAIIPQTLKRLAAGLPVIVEGDGLQTRDFIYVGDTVDATLRLAFQPGGAGETYNLGSGRELAINDLLKTICEICGAPFAPERRPARPADVRRHLGGVDKVRAIIGEPAPTLFAEGLRRTIEWYRT